MRFPPRRRVLASAAGLALLLIAASSALYPAGAGAEPDDGLVPGTEEPVVAEPDRLEPFMIDEPIVVDKEEPPADFLDSITVVTLPDQAPVAPRSVRVGDHDLWLQPAEPAYFAALVDSNSPAFVSSDGMLNVFNSAWGATFRSRGFPEHETIELVTLPRPERPGHVWMETLWRGPDSGKLYGWYHFELEDLACLTAPIIGAATSMDDGLTWEDLGFVLQNGYDDDCSYDNGYFTGGNGDFSVILDVHGEFFYFLFSNYGGPVEQQGIGVARSAYSDRGAPGTVMKYFEGGWTEPGMGGKVTPVFSTPTGWATPDLDALWGPSVHWNSHIGAYVALLNRATGFLWKTDAVYVSMSYDLVGWTPPQWLMEAEHFYPQVIGMGPGESDSRAGQRMRLFVAGASFYELEFIGPGEVPSHLLARAEGDGPLQRGPFIELPGLLPDFPDGPVIPIAPGLEFSPADVLPGPSPADARSESEPNHAGGQGGGL